MAAEARSFRGLAGRAAAAWTWWAGELSAMFPRAAAWVSGRRQGMLLRLGLESTELVELDRRGAAVRVLVSWHRPLWEFDEAEGHRIASLCAIRPLSVHLEESLVFMAATRVPRAGGTTREAVGYALLRDSPLLPEDTVFDWRAVPDSAARVADAWQRVEALVCASSTLERIDQALSRWGIAADGVTAGDLSQRNSAGFRLKRRVGLAGRWSTAHTRAALLISLLTLVFAAPLVAGLAAGLEAARTGDQLERLLRDRTRDEPSQKRQAAVRTVRDALAANAGKTRALAVLDDVAYRLGDHGWLDDFLLEGGHLRLDGRSADPARAAREISTSPRLQDVRLEATNAAASADGTNAFRIVARVRGAP